MTETIKVILSIISAIGVFAGILAWWIGKMLSDKKDSITHALQIDFLKNELAEIKSDLKEFKRIFDIYKDSQN